MITAVRRTIAGLQSLEASCSHGGYFAFQTDVTADHRAVVVDWLSHVFTFDFPGCSHRTFFLAVSIMDRFLEKKRVQRLKLQLLGIAAFALASLVEDVSGLPGEADVLSGSLLATLCNGAYTPAEVADMRTDILVTLREGLVAPTSLQFAQEILHVLRAGDAVWSSDSITLCGIALYFIEVTALDATMLRFAPSAIAAAGCQLALNAYGIVHTPWVRCDRW